LFSFNDPQTSLTSFILALREVSWSYFGIPIYFPPRDPYVGIHGFLQQALVTAETLFEARQCEVHRHLELFQIFGSIGEYAFNVSGFLGEDAYMGLFGPAYSALAAAGGVDWHAECCYIPGKNWYVPVPFHPRENTFRSAQSLTVNSDSYCSGREYDSDYGPSGVEMANRLEESFPPQERARFDVEWVASI
jgi:hypothetical protein